ncbi:DEAD/DEAH box helicase [Klebsiella pneumoniae]
MKKIDSFIIEKIFNSAYFKKLYKKIIKAYSALTIESENHFNISNTELRDIFRFIDLLANSSNQNARMCAYHWISLLEPFSDKWGKFSLISSLVYSKLGLYALDFNDHALPFSQRLENEAKKSAQTFSNTYIFTDAQFDIYTDMLKSPYYSFSGPTSLGKSFILKRYIEEIIQNSTSNIVILVPTRALISQFSLEIKNELHELIENFNYKIVTHGSLASKSDAVIIKHIFILTPERLLNLFSQGKVVSIDYLFVDEAHKLSNNDDSDVRSLTEYNAIDSALFNNPNMKIVFSSPNIENPEVFLNLFGREKIYASRIIESPVSQNLYLIEFHQIRLSENIVLSPLLIDSIKKISNYIHPEYYLAMFLMKRIAYHHGQLPQAIRNIVEELFRKGDIDFIFCTPTLVEGVNMPTRNIFINCDDKIRLIADAKKNPNKTLAFWNLAGRAGRYCKELSGNIFCLQDESNRWDNTDIFLEKTAHLTTTIDARIESKSGLREIERYLSDTETDIYKRNQAIEYLANIMAVDTIRFKNNLKDSFVLRKFYDIHREELLSLAKLKANDILDIPIDIINSYKSLNFKIQRKVFDYVSVSPVNKKLPSLDYANILSVLELFYDLYRWGETETKYVKSKGQLTYFATLMNQWTNDYSINRIINENIDIKRTIVIERGQQPIPFDKNDINHVNKVIDDILYNIERILSFFFEKYFNHYYKCLAAILGEDNAGHNWATFLEYGSKNPLCISLQTLGISRHAANIIASSKELRKYLKFNEDSYEIISVNKQGLLNSLQKDSVEYGEVKIFL